MKPDQLKRTFTGYSEVLGYVQYMSKALTEFALPALAIYEKKDGTVVEGKVLSLSNMVECKSGKSESQSGDTANVLLEGKVFGIAKTPYGEPKYVLANKSIAMANAP